MSNNFLGILLNSNPKNPSLKETPLKKRGNSQNIFQRIPDIITQVKPSYLNNYSQPLNLHKSSFTPSNKSRDIFQSDLLLPQKSPDFIDKKTLILDLDETLVHSSPSPFDKNDIVLEVEFDGILYNIYVLIRPGAENFIKKMSKFFEVVIFTASISRYASPLLDKLDKENNIKYRLYREHCTFLNGIYIKELKRLNRDLKDLIIVDNSPLAFAFDSENGLPIKSWYDDKNDNEFENISILLEFLAKVNDVREYIYLLTLAALLKIKIKERVRWLVIKETEIQAPIDLEKCLNIFLMHLKTKILLELIKSKISPTALFNISLSFIKLLFVISLNLQSHVAVISFKSIPLYWHPSSHNEAFGKISFILSLRGISFLSGFSKS